MRRAAKTDDAKGAIVAAGEEEGWQAFDVRLPCDVLWWHPVLDVLQWTEIKTIHVGRRKPAVDKRQEAQRKFLAWTSCPIVTNKDELLAVLIRHYPSDVARPDLIAYARKLREDFERDWKRDGTAVGAAMRIVA